MTSWVRGTASDQEWDEETEAANSYRLRDTMQVAAQQAQQREQNVVGQLQSQISGLFNTAQTHYQNAERSIVGGIESTIANLRTMGQSGQTQFPLAPPPDMFGRTDFGPSVDTSVGLPEMPLTTQAADETLDTSGFSPNAPGLVAEGIEGAGVTDWLGQGDPNAPSAFTALGEGMQGVTDFARTLSDQAPPMSTPRLATGAMQGAANMAKMIGGSADEIRRTAREGDTPGAIGNVLAGAGTALSPGSMLHGAAREVGIPDTVRVGEVDLPAANLAGLAGDIAMPATALDNVIGALVGKGAKLSKELLSGTAEALNLDPVALLRRAKELGHTVIEDVGQAVGRSVEDAGGIVPLLERGEARLSPEPSKYARRFHGTGSTFDTPIGERFDENGLYGPGYYLTSEARVAGTGDVANPGYAEARLSGVQPQIDRLNREIEELRAYPDSYRNGPLRQHFPDDADARAIEAERQIATLEAKRDALAASSAPQIRPVDVPQDLNLLDMEAPVTTEVLERLRATGMLRGVADRSFEWHVYNKTQGITGDEVWKELRKEMPARRVNETLAAAGYDGIKHEGGKYMPLKDDAGNDIRHDVNIIFPKSLPKLRNALSGLEGGSIGTRAAVDLGAGAAGAGASQVGLDEDTPLGERVARGAAGFVGGVAAAEGGRKVAQALTPKPPVPPAPIPSTATRESVTETIDRILQSQKTGGITPAPSTAIEQALTKASTQLQTAAFDATTPLRVLQETVYNRLGRAPTAAEDAWVQARLYAGRGGAVAQGVEENVLPALKGLSEADEAHLNAYLAAADNVDKAAAVGKSVETKAQTKQLVRLSKGLAPGKVDPAAKGAKAASERVFSGGVHAQKLSEVHQEFVNRLGQQKADQLLQSSGQLWDFTKSLRNRMADAGLIDDATRQEWETAFPHYVRAEILKYLPQDEAGHAAVKAGKPLFTVSDIGVKSLTEEGTAKARDLPVNSIIRQAFAVEQLARRNEIAQSILKMRDVDPELQTLMKPVLTFAEAKAQGLTKGQFVPQDYRLDKNAETTFSVFVDGKKQEFVVPKSLEQTFRIDPGQVPAGVRLFATMMGAPLLRATATTMNARFIPLNAIRDAHTFMRRAPVWFKNNPAVAGGELARAYIDSFSGGKFADWEQLRRLGGGSVGDITGGDPKDVLRKLRRDGVLRGLVRPVDTKADFLGAVGDVLALPFQPLKAVGEKIEAAPRLAAYRMAIKSGMDPNKAALSARDITMDFSRAGTFSRVANVIVPFFNVGMQAPERLITLDFKSGRRLGSAISLASSVAIPVIAAEAWNQANYPQDYANVPDYLKDRGLVIMLPIDPGKNPDGTPAQRPYMWVPLDPSLSFINTIIREGINRPLGKSERSWKDVLGAVTGSLSPVPAEPGGAVAAVLPPVLQELAEQVANYDFFRGREIVPESTLGKLLPRDQAQSNTSALAKAMPFVGGSPVRTEHAIRSSMPGVANILLPASDVVAGAFGGRKEPSRNATLPALNIPGVGGMASTVIRQSGGQREENVRRSVNEQKQKVLERQTARVKASDAYKRATPERQRKMLQEVANEISADFSRRQTAEAAKVRSGR